MPEQLIAELLQAAHKGITDDVCFKTLLKYLWANRKLEEEMLRKSTSRINLVSESLERNKRDYHNMKYKILDSGEIIVNNGDSHAAFVLIGNMAIQLTENEKAFNELLDEYNELISEYKAHAKKTEKYIKTMARYCKWYVKSILIKEQVENSGEKFSFHKACEQIAGDESLDTSTITKGINKFLHLLDHFGKSRKSEISENS